jgi:hypothetical protein
VVVAVGAGVAPDGGADAVAGATAVDGVEAGDEVGADAVAGMVGAGVVAAGSLGVGAAGAGTGIIEVDGAESVVMRVEAVLGVGPGVVTAATVGAVSVDGADSPPPGGLRKWKLSMLSKICGSSSALPPFQIMARIK